MPNNDKYQKLVWKQVYSSNFEILDNQHKKIIRIVNELNSACQHMHDRAEILELLKEMDFYALDHFSEEEFYMKKYNYPEYNQHYLTHQYFKKKYRAIRENFIYEKTDTVYTIALHLLAIMDKWLKNHLDNEDYKLALFLKNQVQ